MARILDFRPRPQSEQFRASTFREYEQSFVATTDALVGAFTALYMFREDLQHGAARADDPAARVVDFEAELVGEQEDQQRYFFEITVRWSTEERSRQQAKNPTEEPPRFEWGTYERQAPVLVDSRGNPIINTAGSPIALQEEQRNWQIDVIRNVSTVPTWVMKYAQAVNSDTVVLDGLAFAPRTLAVQALRVGPEVPIEDTGNTYREIRISLQHNRDTWDVQLLNRGFYERRADYRPDGTIRLYNDLVPIVDANGDPITEPQFLNESGIRPRVFARRDGSPKGAWSLKSPLEPQDIYILRFRVRPELPFRPLLS